MAGIQKQPETPEPSVNGHKLSADFAAADIAAVKTLGRSDDREATRYLSAATQLDIWYARAVVKKVMNERFRALAPAFGIDVPVVTMWAIKALRARAQRDPEPFSSQNLHTALAEALDHESGLAKNLHNIRVYERLFVNGLHIQKNRQLLPDPLCAPPTSVNKGLLSAAALHPSPEARTYVCVEMPGWQGQLVVTLFIRAVNAGGSLYVEYTFRVLPPLKAKFLWIDRFDELTVQRRLRHSLGVGILTMVRALLASPYWAIKTYRQPHPARRRQLRQRSVIERGYVFDYGVQRSIREDTCGTRRYHYFLAQDETMYILLAQQTLIRAVEKFLDDHGVDLDQFNDQVKIILDKSINVGNISDSSGVVIGDNSLAKVNDSAKEKK